MTKELKADDSAEAETEQASQASTDTSMEKPMDDNPASFTAVFTSLTGALALMVSSIPIALTNFAGLPIYSTEFRVLVPTITSIFGYVGIALVFHFRHSIMAQSSIAKDGKWTRGPALTWAPILLVLVCVLGLSGYYYLVIVAQDYAAVQFSPVWPYISFVLGFTSPVIALSFFALSEYYLRLMNTSDQAIISRMQGE